MTTALFDNPDVTHAADHEAQRAVRRLALGGVLQLIRARNKWKVADAASHASIASMTWRRVEDGMPVRERSHAALDRLLDLPFGSVKRALNDDLLMVDIVRLAGVDARHVAADNAADFLARFADQMRTGSPRQERTAAPPAAPTRPASEWPAIDEATRLALQAFSMHVPTVKPTDLELVNRVVEQLTRSTVQSPAVRELIQAAARAVPDLIAQQLNEAVRDLADSADPLSAEHDEEQP